jgi:hypothetical protein
MAQSPDTRFTDQINETIGKPGITRRSVLKGAGKALGKGKPDVYDDETLAKELEYYLARDDIEELGLWDEALEGPIAEADPDDIVSIMSEARKYKVTDVNELLKEALARGLLG